jgi:heat shock protein HspQ
MRQSIILFLGLVIIILLNYIVTEAHPSEEPQNKDKDRDPFMGIDKEEEADNNTAELADDGDHRPEEELLPLDNKVSRLLKRLTSGTRISDDLTSQKD